MNVEWMVFLILVILWLICCQLSFFVGRKFQNNKNDEEVGSDSVRDSPCVSEEEYRRTIRSEKEFQNMLTYNGDEQPEIQTDQEE